MEENNFLNEKDTFEDIISDTSKENMMSSQEFFDVYSDTAKEKAGRHAAEKKSFGAWWKKLKIWQKTVLISATSLLLVVAIIATVLFTVFDYNYNDITANPNDLGFEEVINKNVKNIALFGIDTRNKNSFKGLSDSIMILSLNTKDKTVKIISVMRDTLVPIENNGQTTYAKINSAYSKGGPELAIKTLNKIFDLDISEYATVNFFGMADIIDAVGGIDAELTSGEISGTNNINGCIDEICSQLGIRSGPYHIKSSGKQHLNGIQAVAYSRIRYVSTIWGTSNDYGRTDRQRYVMEQLFNKAVTLSKSQYVSLAKALIPCAETSLSYTDIMGLATDILLDSPTFHQTRVPLTEYQIGSKSVAGAGSCVYYDLDYAGKIIHAFIYDDITPEDYIKENGVEKNDWYKGGSGYVSNSATQSNSQSNSTGSAAQTQPENTQPEPQPSEEGGSENQEQGETGGAEVPSTEGEETPTTPEETPAATEETPADSGDAGGEGSAE